jgi:hypothetical protein
MTIGNSSKVFPPESGRQRGKFPGADRREKILAITGAANWKKFRIRKGG